MNSKYTTVYEAGRTIFTSSFIIISVAFILTFILGIYIFKNSKGERLFDRIGLFVVSFILGIVILSITIQYFDTYKNVYKKYLNGEYMIVESEIVNYIEHGLENKERPVYDKFSVNEIDFCIPAITGWGYSVLKIEG